MTFDFLTLAIFLAAAVVYALFIPGKWRGWFLFGGSVIAIYWLQTFTAVRFADYILQTTTILLTVLTWWVVRPDRSLRPIRSNEDTLTLLLLFALIIGVACNRFLTADFRFTPSRPPSPLWVAVALLALVALLTLLWQWLKRIERRKLLTAVILLILFIFILLKAPPLTTAIASMWRSLTGQQVALAAPSDLVWLGFSYVAFRLIHTLHDRQVNHLPEFTLREYITYVLFFPSYIAGPIDRVERFVKDYRQEDKSYSVFHIPYSVTDHGSRTTDYGLRYWYGGSRILIGLFKKFVIADTLALGMSLTAVNAAQATSPFWLWALLYGYALRLFFDFSGYSDIAIGLGILFGVKLPENFRRPYLTHNITAFWQRWHISLSDWARFYVFTPLSRALLRRKRKLPANWPTNGLILLSAHLTTMLVIGLWHGITWNFFIWGLWHGLALFTHKQWSDRTRKWYRGLNDKPRQKQAWTIIGWFLTFQYVVLGWVWFALPTPELALQTFAKLFGD